MIELCQLPLLTSKPSLGPAQPGVPDHQHQLNHSLSSLGEQGHKSFTCDGFFNYTVYCISPEAGAVILHRNKPMHCVRASPERQPWQGVMSLAQWRMGQGVRGMRWYLQLQLQLFSSLCSPIKDKKWGGRMKAPCAWPGSCVESFW